MTLVEKIAKHLWEALQAISYPKWEANSDAGLKGDYRDESSSILKLILSDLAKENSVCYNYTCKDRRELWLKRPTTK